MSGALFLLLPGETPEQKVDLRARFSAGVCALLIKRRLITNLQVEKQLSGDQLEILRELPSEQNPPPEVLWGHWLDGRPLSDGSILSAWIQLGADFVGSSLRDEPEPPAVDWGQREQEFQAQLASFPGKVEIDLAGAHLRISQGTTVTAQSPIQVMGTYHLDEKAYLAGWADPQLTAAARPLPVFGCASQLFRIEPVEAASEAHRAAWLGRVRHLLPFSRPERVYFLGLESLAAPGSSTSFGRDDLRPEMLSRVKTLLKAVQHYEPERVKSMLTAQGQEVERLLPLVETHRATKTLLQTSAETLYTLADRISTHNLVGGRRSEVRSKDRDLLEKELSQLSANWEEP